MSLVGEGRGTGAAGGHCHIPVTPQVMEAVKAENQTGLLVINIKYIVSSPVKGDCIYFIEKELKFARGAQGAVSNVSGSVVFPSTVPDHTSHGDLSEV